jgi:hypothetical protein
MNNKLLRHSMNALRHPSASAIAAAVLLMLTFLCVSAEANGLGYLSGSPSFRLRVGDASGALAALNLLVGTPLTRILAGAALVVIF